MLNKKLLLNIAIAITSVFGINGVTNAQTYLPHNYWTFDSPNNLKDSMNHSDLDPSYYNSPYSVTSGGSSGVGKCLTLTEASNRIVASDPLPLDTGFTAEFLFRPSKDINETVSFISRRDGGLNFRFGYATFRFSTKILPTGSTVGVTDNFDIMLSGTGRGSYDYYTDGNWHHLVIKYNTKTGVKEVWVDGQLPDGFSTVVTPTGRFASNSASPGSNICDINSNTYYYKYYGDLDEIAVYTYPLPANMIYKHYNEFTQKQHYSFSNSTIAPPPPASIAGAIDPNEYGPGHPTVNVDALIQLKNFPAPRFKPGNTLKRNIPVFNYGYLSGQALMPNSLAVPRSKEFQREFVTNYNYTLSVTGNTHNISNFGDTTTFDGAWVKMANDNPSWETSAIAFWAQTSPSSIGKTAAKPYMRCGCLPNSSYLRNSSGQFLDRSGNVATIGKTLSPEAPLDSIYFDGQAQRYYLTRLFAKMTRPLNNLFENGEIVYHYNATGIQNDPVVAAAIAASGLDGKSYVGNRMKRFSDAYTNQFRSMPEMANTRFIHYQITGHEDGWKYNQTRTINSPVNGKQYSSGDIYTSNPRNWRFINGSFHGWQYVVDSRFEELKYGDSLFSPVVSPGWSYDEERFVRPGQWLGLLKAIAMTGVEHFMTGYFVEVLPPQNPDNYVWIMSLPPMAQAISSRYEDFLRNGHLMDGDVPNSITNTSEPGYSFKAGEFNKLVVARKHNTQNKYAITGTIQPYSNIQGNAPLTGIASINLDGQTLKFNISRQGSTYIYDKTVPSAPVFYQLDGWHEYKHPYHWSKTFDIEAELYDNSAPVSIKTKVPAGTPAGDFTNYTSYISFNTAGTVEYNFQPRGTSSATYYVWILARSKDGSTQNLNVTLDGNITKTIGCIQDTNWTWYRFDAGSQTALSFNNLSLQNHKLSVTSGTSKIEIDKITVSPNSGIIYTTNVAPVCTTGVSGLAIITASGSTSLCPGGSVTLTANNGTAYLWSTGATTKSIIVSTAGSYVVTVTNGTPAVSLPEVVVVNPLPTNGVTVSGPTTIPCGGSVTLTANSTTGTYLWSPGGETTRSITVSSAGNYSVVITGAGNCSVTSPVTTVSVSGSGTQATISASGTTTFCQGNSVNLTANVGTTYLWSTGATTRTISTGTAGTYLVTVTYASGCSSTSSGTTITVNPTPSNGVTASGATTFCSGGSVTLTASSATGNYLWSNGATTRAITVTNAGNYSVVVTGTGGCSATSPVTTVTISGSGTPASITSSGTTTFCQGGSVTLTANTGSTYLWSNGATTRTITASADGNYSVTVTYASGCSSTSPATTITVNALPSNGVTASGSTTFCNGGSVTLTASSATGSYLWSNGATTRAITITNAGNYSVVVTGAGNCSVTSLVTTVTVNGTGAQATITAIGSTTFCQGGSVNLSANTGTNYLWSTGATTNSITANTSGSYLVTVTYSGGCTSTSSPTVVTANPLPQNGVTASGPTTFCSGGSVTLTANSATGSYLWSNGATTRAITVTNAGNYSVVVTNASNCSSTSPVTTVAIGGSGTPATITPSGTTNFCQGGSVGLTANLGSSYLWSTGATTRTITVNSTGNYSVTVTYTGGCTSTSPITSVTANAIPANGITASGPTTFCSGGSVTLTANSATGTYLWSNGATTRAITVTTAGNYSVVVTGTGNCQVTSPITTVTLNGIGTPATITASSPTTFCQGGNVNLTANLGSSYLWSTGATTRSITVSSSANYLVTVSYSGGCNSTSPPMVVTANPLPQNGVTASGPTTICTGGSVTLTANSTTGSYLWSNGATTRAITVTNAGNYSVVITSASYCSSASPVTTVTIGGSGTPASITPSGTTTFCQGGSVNLSANLGSSYLWSTGATTNSITANTSGSYLVTVTYSGGCSSTSSPIVVTANPIPSNGVTASGSTTFCSGGSVTLTANSATGSYLWSNGATTRAITVTNAGNYSVVVTSASNCSSASPVTTVTIVGSGTPASITPSGNTTFCQGGSVDLTANSGSSYLWSTGATTNSITTNTSGSYLVTVTYSGGCSSTSSPIVVTANPIPSNGVTASGPTTFCSGGSVTLTANSVTGSYLWSNGATTRAITVTNAGNYSVVVTGTGNCSSTSAPTVVTVGSGSISTPTITSNNGNNFICGGSSITLKSSIAPSYLWSTGATTRSISVSAAGTYYVTVNNGTGCGATSVPMIVSLQTPPSFTVSVTGPLTFCVGGSVTFNVSQSLGQSYVWFKDNLQIPGANSPAYTATSAGGYRVRVQQNGCAKNSGTGNVTTPCREGETLPESMQEIQVSVYPNPFSIQATITFTLPADDQVTVKIFDMDGRLVDILADKANYAAGDVEIKYNATALRKGLYFATVTTGNYGTKTIKMSSL